MNYKLEQRAKVLVTYDIAQALLETITISHWKKVMIVIDSFLLTTKEIQAVFKAFEQHAIDYIVYDEVIPEPPIELIDQGATLCIKAHCDCIVAIGGGSVIDAARGINIVRLCGGHIKEYIENKKITERCAGLIAIPTTSGTGSELSNALVVSDVQHQQKLAILSDLAVSEYVLLAPTLTKSMPRNLTVQTGLDVFSHAAEAYTSTLSSPIVDAICEKIMFLVVTYLPQVIQDENNLEMRERMMVAAALGGWVINQGGTHLGHSIGHIVGAKYHIPHGMACAYALPEVLRECAKVETKKICEIGHILGLHFPSGLSKEEIGSEVANAYKAFRDDVLHLKPLAEWNIPQEELCSLSEAIVQERFASNTPFKVDDEIVSSIMKHYG